MCKSLAIPVSDFSYSSLAFKCRVCQSFQFRIPVSSAQSFQFRIQDPVLVRQSFQCLIPVSSMPVVPVSDSSVGCAVIPVSDSSVECAIVLVSDSESSASVQVIQISDSSVECASRSSFGFRLQ